MAGRRTERTPDRVRRAADAPMWTDPASGYRRRAAPPSTGGPLELVEVELPVGAEVAFGAETCAFVHHQVWVTCASGRASRPTSSTQATAWNSARRSRAPL